MSIESILNTRRSMQFYLRRQEITANNLANAGSDAFKASRLTAHAFADSPQPVPVEALDLTQGTLRETGRSLDLSLEGPGFFVVDTEGGERLTRGGSLELDGSGRLTDLKGNPLLGADGPIVVQGADVEVRDDGSVMVDGRLAGRLRVENVEDPQSLLKEGNGRFVAGGSLAPAGSATRVRQGSVEQANIDPLLSMVDLITIRGAYAANAEALQAMDGVLGVVANDVGKF